METLTSIFLFSDKIFTLSANWGRFPSVLYHPVGTSEIFFPLKVNKLIDCMMSHRNHNFITIASEFASHLLYGIILYCILSYCIISGLYHIVLYRIVYYPIIVSFFVLFLTEEAYSHGGFWTRELGQTPLC